MAFHFCAHSWEVRDMDGATLVRFSQRDLDPDTVAVLVDDLFELVQESGQPNLYLDFGAVRMLASVVIGKLIALNSLMREHAGKLTLLNVKPMVRDALRAARVTEVLDVRAEPAADTIY